MIDFRIESSDATGRTRPGQGGRIRVRMGRADRGPGRPAVRIVVADDRGGARGRPENRQIRCRRPDRRGSGPTLAGLGAAAGRRRPCSSTIAAVAGRRRWRRPPSSPLERDAGRAVRAVSSGRSTRGTPIATTPPSRAPTPVVTATIRYADGRPEETVRLPDAGDVAAAAAISGNWRWPTTCSRTSRRARRGRATAAGAAGRGRTRGTCAGRIPGCPAVTLSRPDAPDPRPRARPRGRWRGRGRARSTSTPRSSTRPERIGDYPCDAS